MYHTVVSFSTNNVPQMGPDLQLLYHNHRCRKKEKQTLFQQFSVLDIDRGAYDLTATINIMRNIASFTIMVHTLGQHVNPLLITDPFRNYAISRASMCGLRLTISGRLHRYGI